MELIVEPTLEEYNRNSASVRHAYLACLVTYYAVDRAAYPKEPTPMAERWMKELLPFSWLLRSPCISSMVRDGG